MNNANRRFWYFEGDWFFEQYYEGVGYQVIRYQVLKDSMHKLFNGREYPFSEGEQQTLIDAIKRYHAAVSEKLYSLPNKSSVA